jgi:hypothetical protein
LLPQNRAVPPFPDGLGSAAVPLSSDDRNPWQQRPSAYTGFCDTINNDSSEGPIHRPSGKEIMNFSLFLGRNTQQ